MQSLRQQKGTARHGSSSLLSWPARSLEKEEALGGGSKGVRPIVRWEHLRAAMEAVCYSLTSALLPSLSHSLHTFILCCFLLSRSTVCPFLPCFSLAPVHRFSPCSWPHATFFSLKLWKIVDQIFTFFFLFLETGAVLSLHNS